MLYDKFNDDLALINIYKYKSTKLNIKKVAIFITSILVCFLILFGSFFISYNKINTPKVEETTAQAVVSKPGETIAQKEHIQIARHNLEKIKMKFIPEYNENAQQEIKDLYFSTEKVAYLTFDDGPSATVTPQILDILKTEQIPATFFLVGARVKLYPYLVKRAYDEGHYLANHGYSHKYSQIYQSADTIFGEYVDCENAVREALGIPDYRMFLFRYPGGSSGGKYSKVKSASKELLNSYSVVHTNWNCMTGDAEGQNTVEDQLNTLKETMEGDDTIIVLMHDASDKQVTVEALPEVIKYLREQGYIFKNFYEVF